MVGLGHGEAARKIEAAGGGQEPAVMDVRAEAENGAGEESELDSESHQQAEVAVAERLDGGQVGGRIVGTAAPPG